MQLFKSFKKVAEKLIMSPCQKLYFLFIVIAWSVSSSNVWKAGIFRYTNFQNVGIVSMLNFKTNFNPLRARTHTRLQHTR
jgi:hypothetical protein